ALPLTSAQAATTPSRGSASMGMGVAAHDGQHWRVDAGPGVLRSAADSGFCLDSRGSTDRGVGIWECDSVYGRNGRNLRFAVDPDGTIRPAIDTGTAVTPDDGDGVALAPLGGGPAQRWRAGSA
ncbi:ricin-type beta-trefoil lectin domain protein, partial [Streptomyces sp. NPDC004011]